MATTAGKKAKAKNTLWSKINKLKAKRVNKQGRVVKAITKQEQALRKQAEKKRGTTARGKQISRALRKAKPAMKKAAKNPSVKRNRAKTMQKVYHR